MSTRGLHTLRADLLGAARAGGRYGLSTGAIGMRFLDGALLLPDATPVELAALERFLSVPVEAGERGTLVAGGELLTASRFRDWEG